jgi:phosphoenolpyruvate phosphomutase
LIHSKRPTADEIVEFMGRWSNRCPVIIVPTTYSRTPTEVFERSGVSLAIWANHLVRSCITAMRRTARRVQQERSVAALEAEVASVRDVFRLQDAKELEMAEAKYLPSGQASGPPVAAAPTESHAEPVIREPSGPAPVGGQSTLVNLVNGSSH